MTALGLDDIEAFVDALDKRHIQDGMKLWRSCRHLNGKKSVQVRETLAYRYW